MPGETPPEPHPEVAAVLAQARRLEDVLEARLDEMRTGRFTASDSTRTVEVTIDSNYQLLDVFVAEGALRQGLPAVERCVNEALSNANRHVDANASAAIARINEVVSDITGPRT